MVVHLNDDQRRDLARHLGDPRPELADDPLLGPTSPYDDSIRADDPEDHGDPRIEGWAAALARFGDEVCARTTIACARLGLPMWRAQHPGDERLEEAVAACEAHLAERRPIAPAIGGAVDAAEGEVRWAHEHDAVRAVQVALRALSNPASARFGVAHAALFAFRIVGWATAPGVSASSSLMVIRTQISGDPELTAFSSLFPGMRARAIVRVLIRRALSGDAPIAR